MWTATFELLIGNPLNPVADVLKHPVCLLSAALSEHSTDDMQVSVIRTGFRDVAERRCFEVQMIFSHYAFHPRGLNTDFAFISHSLKSTRANN